MVIRKPWVEEQLSRWGLQVATYTICLCLQDNWYHIEPWRRETLGSKQKPILCHLVELFNWTSSYQGCVISTWSASSVSSRQHVQWSMHVFFSLSIFPFLSSSCGDLLRSYYTGDFQVARVLDSAFSLAFSFKGFLYLFLTHLAWCFWNNFNSGPQFTVHRAQMHSALLWEAVGSPSRPAVFLAFSLSVLWVRCLQALGLWFSMLLS